MLIEQQQIKNSLTYKLFFPLNTDTLSSYLTPILAQFNIQYNEFIIFFLTEYKKFLGEYLSYILLQNITTDAPFSLYNLRIRLDLQFEELHFNMTPKYEIKFKPLILNHILLYYFYHNYKKKYKLEIINILKIGVFFWWINKFNIIYFSKIRYKILQWYIALKKYRLTKLSLRFKNVLKNFNSNKYFLQYNYNYHNMWIFNQKFYLLKNLLINKYIFTQNYQFSNLDLIFKINYSNNKILDDNIKFWNIKYNLKKFKLQKNNFLILKLKVKLDLDFIYWLKNEFYTDKFNSWIYYIQFQNKIYTWLFFKNNYILKIDFNSLFFIFNLILLYTLFFNKTNAYYKFIIK